MDITIIYSDNHKNHAPPFEIYDGVMEPHAEVPERIESILKELKRNGITKIYPPNKFSLKYIQNIHHKEYINFLQSKTNDIAKDKTLFPSYYMTDTYTPLQKKTYDAALSAVDVALTGAELILKGERLIYSLCRPPGHHAEHTRMGGYCYFNNAAIAAEVLSQKGKVAILDIDYHHGNGTQEAFYERDDILYVSIHADPKFMYPYIAGFSDEKGKDKGIGFNKNYPLVLKTNEKKYLATFQQALEDVKRFSPDFLVVSLGFDTYKKDPLGSFSLDIPFYKTLGSRINKINIPTLLVQEGGYCVDDLGKIAVSFLQGFDVFNKV